MRIQCGGRLVSIFSTLLAIRDDKRHRCCVMEWACCRWCQILKGCVSLHEAFAVGNITIWMETQTTNQQQCDHGRWLEANVGQQYRKGSDRLLRLHDVNSTDNNQCSHTTLRERFIDRCCTFVTEKSLNTMVP